MCMKDIFMFLNNFYFSYFNFIVVLINDSSFIFFLVDILLNFYYFLLDVFCVFDINSVYERIRFEKFFFVYRVVSVSIDSSGCNFVIL